MQKPSIGRIVIVSVDPARNNGATEAPAQICRVWSDALINVRALLDGREVDWMTSVPLYATQEDFAAAKAEIEQSGDGMMPAAWWPPRI